MKIATTRLGALYIAEEKMILMQRGILGFEGYKRFVLLMPSVHEPLFWLQAADEPALAFVVANPGLIKKDYKPAIMPDELELLDIRRSEDIVLLAIMTMQPPPLQVTANLRAPILINAANRKANQVILADPTYPMQYLVFDNGAKTSRNGAAQQQAGAGQLDKLAVAMTGS